MEAFGQTHPETQEPQGPGIELGALAIRLKGEFDDAKSARRMVEQRWLDDLRQYRGQYSPQVLNKLNKQKRSKVFYRMTTSKVNTLTARLMDLLFPQRSKNWGIEPSPDPVMPDDIIMDALQDEIAPKAQEILAGILQELQAQDVIPDMWAMNKFMAEAHQQAFAQANTMPARLRIAQERASAMERVIDDQLKEFDANSQRRPSWQQNCRAVIKSACLHGMGVLKGPLIEQVETKRFFPTRDGAGNTRWTEQIHDSTLRPYHEAVSIWDVFPDPGARVPEELRFVWQLHMMTDKDLKELASFPGFSKERIAGHMGENEDGDAQLSEWEAEIRDLNADNAAGGINAHLKHRYRVYERWGFLSGEDLAAAGAAVADKSKVYSANIWLIGDTIIKAMINPLEGIDIPYFFYPFQMDETSFWPEGVAAALRGPQAGINAAVRAMQDNSATTAGPIMGLNLAHLSQDESPTDMMANRLFLFDKMGVTLDQVFRAVTVPSAIEHNLAQSSFWQNAADEASTPRFNSGDGNIAGAGKTASGLSMLMGAANILLKDHVKDFDDAVAAPFIRAMFRWNMQWNPDESIKGDFHIVASGSQSLIAKEVRAQQIPVILNYLGVPGFARHIDDRKLLEVALEQTDLPVDRILRSKEEAVEYEQQQMMMQAEAQAQAQVQALVQQLESQGMPRDAINQQMLLLLAQITQTQGAQSGMPGGGGVPQ